jgi:ubiquinone/menaquinone biosynthesis C-methylase UbiE
MTDDTMIGNPRQKEFFDQNADQWDRISVHDLDKVGFITGLLELNGDERIMDVGTGTGVMIPFYERSLTSGHVLAIDYSENMISMARRKYPPEGHTRITFEVKDLYDIDDIDAFDSVVCYSCFPHFPDQSRAVSIFQRALRMGGSLMIAHSCSRDRINQVHKEGGSAISHDYLPDMKAMKMMMTSAGLRISYTKDDEDYFIIIGHKV